MEETRTTIRLPEDLHVRVRRLAERDRRSVHAQLLVLIERGLALEESIPAGLASLEAIDEIYRRATEGIPGTEIPRARRIAAPREQDQGEDHDDQALQGLLVPRPGRNRPGRQEEAGPLLGRSCPKLKTDSR